MNIVTGDRIGFERKYYIIDLVWKDELKKNESVETRRAWKLLICGSGS